MYFYVKLIVGLALRILNRFIPTSSKAIYFIPHINCLTDRYDMINFHSDNVLCFFNYLLRKEEFRGYTFYIDVHFPERIPLYERYCLQINPHIQVKYISVKKMHGHLKWKHFLCCCRACKIFTASFHYNFSFKTKKQKVICLGYYTPFKNDYHVGKELYNKEEKIRNRSFDWHITTSDISSRIIALDSGISYSKFKALGAPRLNYLTHTDKGDIIKAYIKGKAGYVAHKIIVYTPTYRDYENTSDRLPVRSVLGYEKCNLKLLSEILEKNGAVLYLKLHPFQRNQAVLQKEDIPANIIIYEANFDFSLYDVMAIADYMITDYTSAYYDFLIKNKPVIFNFYDIDKYRTIRGFSFNPIEFLCAGEIVHDYQELLEAIQNMFNRAEKYKEQRENVNLFINQCLENHPVEDFSASIFRFVFDHV